MQEMTIIDELEKFLCDELEKFLCEADVDSTTFNYFSRYKS